MESTTPHPIQRYLTDEKGRRIGVVLDIPTWEKIVEELEELDDIRAFDAAKMEKGDSIPLEQALGEIERNRK